MEPTAPLPPRGRTDRRDDSAYMDNCFIVPAGDHAFWAGKDFAVEGDGRFYLTNNWIARPRASRFWTRPRLQWAAPLVGRLGLMRTLWRWLNDTPALR